MKRSMPLVAPLLAASASLSGCQLIGDVFKAGVWVGAILVIAVIAIVIWLISRAAS